MMSLFGEEVDNKMEQIHLQPQGVNRIARNWNEAQVEHIEAKKSTQMLYLWYMVVWEGSLKYFKNSIPTIESNFLCRKGMFYKNQYYEMA